MDWDRPILTDSGGFQVVSLGDLRVVDEDGVTFRSHLDGSIHRFTPGARHRRPGGARLGRRGGLRPAGLPVARRGAVVADATARTHRWAERSLAAHTRPDQALFGIIQGGLDPDLRAASTRFIAGLPFDGLCIGGLAGDETPAERDAALDVAVPLLADDPRPRYLMGLGSPADLLEAVHRGVDLFDSVLPGAGRPERAAVGPGRSPQPAQSSASSTTRSRSRRAVRASSAGASRGPIWPICSGPRSSSRTGSRLVTT